MKAWFATIFSSRSGAEVFQSESRTKVAIGTDDWFPFVSCDRGVIALILSKVSERSLLVSDATSPPQALLDTSPSAFCEVLASTTDRTILHVEPPLHGAMPANSVARFTVQLAWLYGRRRDGIRIGLTNPMVCLVAAGEPHELCHSSLPPGLLRSVRGLYVRSETAWLDPVLDRVGGDQWRALEFIDCTRVDEGSHGGSWGSRRSDGQGSGQGTGGTGRRSGSAGSDPCAPSEVLVPEVVRPFRARVVKARVGPLLKQIEAPSVEVLALYGGRRDLDLPNVLTSMVNLRSLDCSMSLGPPEAGWVARLSSLQRLEDLCLTGAADEEGMDRGFWALYGIQSLTSLTSLHLGWMSFVLPPPRGALASLSRLRSLSVTRGLKCAALGEALRGLTSLTSARFFDCKGLDGVLPLLPRTLKSLQLYFYQDGFPSLNAMATRCTELTNLLICVSAFCSVPEDALLDLKPLSKVRSLTVTFEGRAGAAFRAPDRLMDLTYGSSRWDKCRVAHYLSATTLPTTLRSLRLRAVTIDPEEPEPAAGDGRAILRAVLQPHALPALRYLSLNFRLSLSDIDTLVAFAGGVPTLRRIGAMESLGPASPFERPATPRAGRRSTSVHGSKTSAAGWMIGYCSGSGSAAEKERSSPSLCDLVDRLRSLRTAGPGGATGLSGLHRGDRSGQCRRTRVVEVEPLGLGGIFS